MARTARILVADDEIAVRTLVATVLDAEGYQVATAADGAAVLAEANRLRPELVVLDVHMPGGPDGLTVARRLRQEGHSAGLLFLSGADEVAARVAALDAGGDDYLVKPFDPDELVARVAALLRRVGRSGPDVWQVGTLVVDDAAHRVSRGNADIALSPVEYDLLCQLLRHQGHVVTQRDLLTDIWGYGPSRRNVLHAHISGLRHKLEADGDRLIHTVRAKGYVLRPPGASPSEIGR